MNKKQLLDRLSAITSELETLPDDSSLFSAVKDLNKIQTKLEYIIDEVETYGIQSEDEASEA